MWQVQALFNMPCKFLTHFSVAAEVLPHHGRFSVNHGRKNRLIPTCPGIDQMLELVTS